MEKRTTNKLMGTTDYAMAVSVGLCIVLARYIPGFQPMTACIATLLCVQDNVKVSWKAGVTRLIITAVGGVIGIAVVLLDLRIGNPWIFIGLCALGTALTLLSCKLTKVPPFSARIGCITFVLVALIGPGSERIPYAVYRLISTFYGVVVVVAVTSAFSLAEKWKESREQRAGEVETA